MLNKNKFSYANFLRNSEKDSRVSVMRVRNQGCIYIYSYIFMYRMNMRTALAKWSYRPLFETPVFFLATLFHLDPDLYVSTQIKIIIKWSFMIIIDE